MTTAIITMAGFGRRFLDAGYTVPKYRIVAHERTLFAWSMLSLKQFIASDTGFVFAVRGADEARGFIGDEAKALGIANHRIVELDEPTDGQATTALLAGPAVQRPDEPMLIYNIDTFVHPDALPVAGPRGDGWIPCFAAKGDHWSFALADAGGMVSEVREKVRISPHATVGLYWFSSYELYAQAYLDYYEEGAPAEANERYVAPLYNGIIRSGRPVYVHEVPVRSVVPLGVPAEVATFIAGPAPELR
jgi:hypothetical protein